MMGTLALASLCIGAALGLRLKVFALFPVILLGFIVVTAWGLAHGQTGWSIVLMNMVGAACLQFGYLGGMLPEEDGGMGVGHLDYAMLMEAAG